MGNFSYPASTTGRQTAFIADLQSTSLLGQGVRVDLAADFAGVETLPAGTVVVIAERVGIAYAVPHVDGPSTGAAYLTATAVNSKFLTGSSDTTGLFTGGNFYSDKLPAPLSADSIADLGQRFHFQTSGL